MVLICTNCHHSSRVHQGALGRCLRLGCRCPRFEHPSRRDSGRRAVRLLTIPLVLSALAVAACLPKAAPVPDRALIAGDSLTIQAGYHSGDLDGVDVIADLGAEAEDVYPDVAAAVADPKRSPSVLVVALGQNDGGHNGLSAQDRKELTQLVLAHAPGARTCILLPYYDGPNVTRRQGVAAVRRWAIDTMDLLPDRVGVTDAWGAVAADHPELLGPDLFHLNVTTPAGPEAYAAALRSAMDGC